MEQETTAQLAVSSSFIVLGSLCICVPETVIWRCGWVDLNALAKEYLNLPPFTSNFSNISLP